jgi:thioredoxin-like negative regulator of GroEL
MRLPEADAVLGLARAAAPEDPEVALHAGRIARKMGDRERALELYVRARELDGRTGATGRLAAMGEAVVSEEPVRALGRLIREAVRAGDYESAAVGLEERARARRAAADRRGAARDLCLAAWRFPDATDRARVAHELADLAVVMGDSLAAREALLLAISFDSNPQRDHARARLHMLARSLGDEVGARRWRSSGRPSLVSLTLGRAKQTDRTAAPLLARWRESIEASLPMPD